MEPCAAKLLAAGIRRIGCPWAWAPKRTAIVDGVHIAAMPRHQAHVRLSDDVALAIQKHQSHTTRPRRQIRINRRQIDDIQPGRLPADEPDDSKLLTIRIRRISLSS
ncbi:MAG: hypothetical protein A3J29_13240 [Acidobacteria bacterium RIFCSPLOWO2_12_FULL_67_14b]|nr:MAG: hypothetical protein A3J29_13240 [Acidobacteria bacterium RIFCSPLOWO2_12_FULL_67_14b]